MLDKYVSPHLDKTDPKAEELIDLTESVSEPSIPKKKVWQTDTVEQANQFLFKRESWVI